MKESTKLNTVFTLLNVSVILFVLIGGAWHGMERIGSEPISILIISGFQLMLTTGTLMRNRLATSQNVSVKLMMR